MAYKFQVGNSIMSGALAQEGDVDILDSGNLKMGGDTIISAAGAVDNVTSIDASGDLTCASITNAEFSVDASGNTDIDGTLNVQGVPTFQAGAVFSSGITTAGAIAGASTITATGKIVGNEFATDGDEFVVSTAGQVTAVGVVAGGAVSAATSVSGSGLFSAAGGLNAGSSRFTVSATGVLSGSVMDGTIIGGTEIVSQGTLSGSDACNIGGMLTTTGDVKFLDIGTDANYARATDGLYYYDATDGELKVSTNDAFLTAIAGDGLSVAGNQLVSDAGSTTPTAFNPATPAMALSEGFNYSTGSADSFTVTLPAVVDANLGDKVQIKAGPLAAGKAITIIPHPTSDANTIDGGTTVILESPYAAITCVYTTSGSWSVL